jgi:short-subunit dehydrogenase
VELLINCSGFGKFGKATDTPLETNLNMIDLNCKAIVSMCQTVLPYMTNGARIINIASVAALQPIPYIAVYGASKAFVLSYSRALNRELKGQGISVTAVCPFWTKTEFFNHAVDKENQVVKKYIAMYEPEQIVKRAIRDAKKRKDVSFYGFKARGQALLVKLLPHKLVMTIWQNQQKLK